MKSSYMLVLKVFPEVLTFILTDFSSYTSVLNKKKKDCHPPLFRLLCMHVFFSAYNRACKNGVCDISMFRPFCAINKRVEESLDFLQKGFLLFFLTNTAELIFSAYLLKIEVEGNEKNFKGTVIYT